jgi:hypothetical protein
MDIYESSIYFDEIDIKRIAKKNKWSEYTINMIIYIFYKWVASHIADSVLLFFKEDGHKLHAYMPIILKSDNISNNYYVEDLQSCGEEAKILGVGPFLQYGNILNEENIKEIIEDLQSNYYWNGSEIFELHLNRGIDRVTGKKNIPITWGTSEYGQELMLAINEYKNTQALLDEISVYSLFLLPLTLNIGAIAFKSTLDSVTLDEASTLDSVMPQPRDFIIHPRQTGFSIKINRYKFDHLGELLKNALTSKSKEFARIKMPIINDFSFEDISKILIPPSVKCIKELPIPLYPYSPAISRCFAWKKSNKKGVVSSIEMYFKFLSFIESPDWSVDADPAIQKELSSQVFGRVVKVNLKPIISGKQIKQLVNYKEEGKHFSSFLVNYHNNYFLKTTDLTNTVKLLLGDIIIVMPNSTAKIIDCLINFFAMVIWLTLYKGLYSAWTAYGAKMRSGSFFQILPATQKVPRLVIGPQTFQGDSHFFCSLFPLREVFCNRQIKR